MRKFDLYKKPSLENTAVEGEQPIAVQPATVVDDITNQVDLQETDVSTDEVVEYSNGLDTLLDTTDALESLVASMESSLKTGGLNRQAFDFAQMHARHLTTNIGLEATIPSLESADSRLIATELAIESLKAVAVDAFKAIVDFMKRLYEAMAKRLSQFKDWIVSSAMISFDKIKTFTDAKFNVKVNVNVAVFKINGTFNGKAVNALEASLSVGEKLVALDDIQEKLYTAFDALASGRNKTSLEDQMREIDSLANQAYSQLDNLLKFDKNTHLTTSLVAGKSQVGLTYENGNPRSFSVATEHNPPELKMMSLRDLGVDNALAEKLKEHLDRLLAMVKSMQDISDRHHSTRWDKYRHITKSEFEQDRVKACTLLSAIISRFERVIIDASAAIYDGFTVLRKVVEDAERAANNKSE